MPNSLAPTFKCLDQQGDLHSLQAYRGRWVVLFFYPKDHTPGCTLEACQFRDQYEHFDALNVVLLGISLDTIDAHQAFAQKHRLPFPLLSDPDGHVAKQYGVLSNWLIIKFAKRRTFVIDPEGFIRLHVKRVNPKSHVNDLLGQIRTLMQNHDAT